jgi:acetyl-CoA C-acetyltransferase
MNLALWIIAGALALVFGLSGLMKLGVWKDKLLASSNMGWAEGFSQAQIRWIDAAEFCGAVGLIAQRFVNYARAEHEPDFSDDPAGRIGDRGFGLAGLVTPALAAHGIGAPSTQYALLENARRAAQGRGREEYPAAMGELLAPFTEVAAKNPFSAAPLRRSAADLVTVTERNRMIADPYPRFVVARDQVNQGAALLLASVGAAQRLGVARDKWVFLRGQANLVERSLLERAVPGEAPSAVAAVRHALEVAHVGLDDIDFFDFYSCFPIAVFNIIEAIGLSASDPRGLTLTGGLPFFGGPGNNYSMHAIAEAPAVAKRPTGWATIETYTVTHGRNWPTGIVMADGDDELLALLHTGDEPVGQRIDVTAVGGGNRVGMSRGPAAQRVSEGHGGVAPAW